MPLETGHERIGIGDQLRDRVCVGQLLRLYRMTK
jgi:hypothetical protein